LLAILTTQNPSGHGTGLRSITHGKVMSDKDQTWLVFNKINVLSATYS